MSQYEYEALDLAEMSKEVERLGKKPGDNSILDNFVQLPRGDGSLLLRLLPRLKKRQLWCGTRTHKLFIGGLERSYHCPRELRDTPNGQYWIAVSEDDGGYGDCPICKYYHKRWQDSLTLVKDSPEQKKLQDYLRKIKPVERYYYNVIAREHFDPKTKKQGTNVGPLILSIGKTVHQKICNGIFGNPKLGKKQLGDVTDPLKGRDFRLTKTVKGDGFPEYGESAFEEPSPAGDPEQWEKWMAQRHDVFSLRKILPFAELERVLMIHTGKIKDTKAGFDTSKYDPEEPQYGGDEEVRHEMGQTAKPVVKQERREPETKAEQEMMTDPAFMAELDGITLDDE